MESDNRETEEYITGLIAEIQDRKGEQRIFMTRDSVIIAALEAYIESLPPSKKRVFIANST